VSVDKQAYLAAFDRNWQKLLQAADLGLEDPVPSCPGWNTGALVGHMGSVFTFWGKWVRERPRALDRAALIELQKEREEALPGFSAWREGGFTAHGVPPGVREFAERCQVELRTRLAELDPAEPVWTFFPGNQTAGFVQRRIAHETAVHCWDAQATHGIAEPLENIIARDGLDEFFDAILRVIYLGRERDGTLPPYSGERYHFHQNDGAGMWSVEFAPEGIQVSGEHAPANVSIGGPASDLLLFLYARVPADSLVVGGDTSLLSRWPELAGSF
jgi:uncharacterized protein (TIGR03083 family)